MLTDTVIRRRRALRPLAPLCLAALLGACAMPEPWVAPYQRGQLADPAMLWGGEPLADRFTQHVRDVRQGARGAAVTAGGGCGCN